MATPFQDIPFKDVAQQGRGEQDTYARKYGFPGWQELLKAGGANLGGGGGAGGGYPGADVSGFIKDINQREQDLFGKFQEAVQPYQTEITKTKSLLDQLEGNINQRVSGTLTSEPLRQRMLASESYPLQTTLSRLGTAEGAVAQPYQSQMQLFGDIASREITGFTADNQAKLDWYSKQASLNQEMTIEQMKEANELLKQEMQYKAANKYGIWATDPATGQPRFYPNTTSVGGSGGGPNNLDFSFTKRGIQSKENITNLPDINAQIDKTFQDAMSSTNLTQAEYGSPITSTNGGTRYIKQYNPATGYQYIPY